jgi:hypothetical protein
MHNFTRLSAVLAVLVMSTALAIIPSGAQTLGPVLQSTTPADGSSVQAAPTISATYNMNLGQLSTIAVRDGTNDLIGGSKTVNGPTITFTPSATITEAGSPYTATATVRDATTGLLRTTSSWSFSIDVTAPSTPTVASVAGDTTSPGAGKDPTPAIVVSGVVAGDTVAVSEGTTVLGSKVVPTGADTVTFNPGQADVEVNLAGDRDHTLAATATDRAGNTSTSSAGFVYALDTTAPAAPSIDSVDGHTPSPATGSDPTPVIVVSGVVAGDSVAISEGTDVLGAKVVPAGASTVTFNPGEADVEVNLAGDVDRDHTVVATATDPVGNTSAASASFSYFLDTGETGPDLVSRSPDGTSPETPASVSATYNQALDTSTSTLTVRNRSGNVLGGATSFSADARTVTFTPSSPFTEAGSPYVVTAEVGDANGNLTTNTWSFAVDTTAPPPPTVASVAGDTTSPAAGKDPTPAIVVSGVVAGDTVAVSEGTTVLGSKVVPAGADTVTFNGGETDAGVTVAGEGDHALTATATDRAGNASAASAPFVYDLVSFDGTFHPLSPARILDTREGNGAPKAKVGPGRTVALQVTGRGNVPANGVSAVVMNVTVTEPTAPSVLTVWPTGEPQPNASNLNYVAGQTVPNLVVVKVGTGGKVNLRNLSGSTHVVADVVGWYDTE